MKRQRGMGMIEILMAVLITAVGLIGITGMQAVSLKNNLSALNRSNAIFLTGTMVDRIRANPQADYKTIYTSVGEVVSASLLASCSANDSNCGIDDIARLHIAQWKCSLGGYKSDTSCVDINPIMPDAEGEITTNGAGDFVITIQWVDRLSYANSVKTPGCLLYTSDAADE